MRIDFSKVRQRSLQNSIRLGWLMIVTVLVFGVCLTAHAVADSPLSSTKSSLSLLGESPAAKSGSTRLWNSNRVLETDERKLGSKSAALTEKEVLVLVAQWHSDVEQQYLSAGMKVANLFEGALAVELSSEWESLATDVELVNVALRRCERHLLDANSPDIARSPIVEASKACDDLRIAEFLLGRLNRSIDTLSQVIEFGLMTDTLVEKGQELDAVEQDAIDEELADF